MDPSNPSNSDCWAYTYDRTFSDPVDSQHQLIQGGSTIGPLVQIDAANIRPRGGFAKALASAPSGYSGETKIIYTIRHGNTPHNDDSDTWGRDVAWGYLASLQKNFDPKITGKGQKNAADAAQQLIFLRDNEEAPLPVTVYSSPLRRCIETTMHMYKNAALGQPVLKIKEGLREWMGWDHGHKADCHGTKEEIKAMVDRLQAQLETNLPYTVDVPEDGGGLRNETYTDVDRRVRGVLDSIFDDPESGECVMLVLHGRSNKSFMRVLGYSPADTEGFELANCAMLSYRVARHRLDPGQAAGRKAAEDAQWEADFEGAESSKQEIQKRAVDQVKDWKTDKDPRLGELRDFLQNHAAGGDEAAREAVKKLRGDLGEAEGWGSLQN